MDERPQAQSTAPGHEPIQLNVRAIWITGFVMAAVVAGSFLLVVGLMKWMVGPAVDMPPVQVSDADPNLVNTQQLQQLRARERKMLSQYEWIDPAAGVARIPIDRAMRIVASKGLVEAAGAPAAPPRADNEFATGAEQVPNAEDEAP